jgi:hypothetical protein
VFAVSQLVRFIAVLLVCLVACVDTPPLAEPVVESSHVEIKEIPASPTVPKVDVLVFVDDSAAMAGYRNRARELATLVAQQIETMDRGWSDVRLAVTSNDGRLRVVPGTQSKTLYRSIDLGYHRWQSYAGSLEDTLAQMMRVEPTAATSSQPLEAIRHALETSSQFLREDAGIAILIISANDDASQWPVADYAAWLRALVAGQWNRTLGVSAIYPEGAARLTELFATVPFTIFGTHTALDAVDYTRAVQPIEWSLEGGWWGGIPCMDAQPADRDPTRPGVQHDCTLSIYLDGELRPLPECATRSDADVSDGWSAGPLPSAPCWRIRHENQCFDDGLMFEFGGYTNGVHPAYRLECRTR